MMDIKGALIIGGVRVPNPNDDSLTQTIATLVNSGRNAEGQFVGQKIGRDQTKIELQWDMLTTDEWAAILSIFERNFVNEVTYFDAVKKRFHTRQFYVGDRSGRPFNPDMLMNPRAWRDCKANLIDTGVGD